MRDFAVDTAFTPAMVRALAQGQTVNVVVRTGPPEDDMFILRVHPVDHLTVATEWSIGEDVPRAGWEES